MGEMCGALKLMGIPICKVIKMLRSQQKTRGSLADIVILIHYKMKCKMIINIIAYINILVNKLNSRAISNHRLHVSPN